MLSWLNPFRTRAQRLDDTLWREAVSATRLVADRSTTELRLLRDHVERFLARIAITPVHGLELDARQRVQLAIQACVPLIYLSPGCLGHWHELVVYPGQFRVRRHHHDDDTSVVTERDDELAGESWSHGPVIVSWADVQQDLAEPFEGFNVLIHEIAHKIDMADGEGDGIPPLSGLQRRRRWKDVMGRAYATHLAEVEAGVETVIDPYAAESPDEFFAVACEYYFSAPAVLAEQWPAVHAELAEYFGPPMTSVAAR
jgi:Mlc titration factor MtfA (ptsG expression regulator)